MNAHRAALEALFAPRPMKATATQPVVSKRDSAKMVTAKSRTADARADELVARLVAAEGRVAISRAAEEVLRAGVAFPDEQEVQLQLLEHADEERVRDAIAALARLVDVEPAKRRALLDSRLRRIEECADEATTRALGSELRRKLARASRPL